MRYYIVDEDGNAHKTDYDEAALKMAEVATVIDTETGKQVCWDDTRIDIPDLKVSELEETDADGDEEQDDSDPGISDRERI